MNHITQLNSMMVLQKKYQNYLPYCTPGEQAILAKEIQKLQARISIINQMEQWETQREVKTHTEIKQSQMNFTYINSWK